MGSPLPIDREDTESEADEMTEDKKNQDAVREDPFWYWQPGSLVLFGRYPQYRPEPDPIEWQVLAREGDVAWLISRCSLEFRQYDRNGGTYSRWRSCQLRKWLNSEFLQTAFSAHERMRLVTTVVPADPNDVTPTSLDPDFRTRDRVWLLNKSEAARFFPTEASRICDLAPQGKRDESYDFLLQVKEVDGEVIQEEHGLPVMERRRGGNEYVWWLWSWSGWWNDVVDWDGRFARKGNENWCSVRPVIRVRCVEARRALKETLRECLPGDFVTYGKYPRRGADPEPLEWQVLARQDGAVRLISRYVLDAKPWHETHETAAWETSSLRAWLNGEFLTAAFSEEDREGLAEADPMRGDKMTLPDAGEVRRLFPSCIQSACFPTPYALGRGALRRKKDGPCWWWLREAGQNRFCAAGIDDRGVIRGGGRYIGENGGVRPVIVVKI